MIFHQNCSWNADGQLNAAHDKTHQTVTLSNSYIICDLFNNSKVHCVVSNKTHSFFITLQFNDCFSCKTVQFTFTVIFIQILPTLEPVQFDLGKFGSSVVALWRHYCQLSYKAPLFINFYACLPNITWFFIAIYIAVIPILIHVSMWFFNFKFLLGSLINHLKCLIP